MFRNPLFIVSLLVVVTANRNNLNELPFGLSWMRAKDRTELAKIEPFQRSRFLIVIYENLDAEEQLETQSEIIPSCYSSWMSVKDRKEVESLHETGDHQKCKDRVREILNNLPDEKRIEIEGYWPFCEHVWYSPHRYSHHSGHKHHRRHVGRHTRHVQGGYDEFAAAHLQWISEEERQEIKKLHEESKDKALTRIFELFDSATGEKKEKAISQMQSACRELIVYALGEDTAKDLRQMKESGSTDEEIKAKIEELLKGVTDEAKKTKAMDYKDACDKVYKAKAAANRRRREEARHHGLESKLSGEWKWLTEEQKTEIRNLKTQGKNDEFLLTQVFEFFKSAEAKDAAEDGLQQSCQGAVLTILGPEKAQILKEFMANGAKPEAYEAKVKELLNQQDKEGARRSLTKNQESCKSVFTAAARRRRDHHHNLEHYLEKHLSWLTDEQKTTLRKLHNEEKDEDKLHAQVMEWYDQATGEKKEQAKVALQSGCRDILFSVIGPEKMEEFKKLKESGSSPTELAAKVEELIKEVSDETKVKRVQKYEVQCKKLFGVGASRRRREDHSHEGLESYLASHLAWLTDAQKEEVRKMKAEGKTRDEMHAKVMEIYDSLSGEGKEKATAELQASCRELYAKYFNAEQMEELKKLKESGASDNDMRAKGDQFVSEISDPAKKKDAEFYSSGCRKVFGVNRKRRHQTHFN